MEVKDLINMTGEQCAGEPSSVSASASESEDDHSSRSTEDSRKRNSSFDSMNVDDINVEDRDAEI